MPVLRLAPLAQNGWACRNSIEFHSDAEAIQLGRTTHGIPARELTISRKHCEVSRDEITDVIAALPFKSVWIVREAQTDAQLCLRGVKVTLRQGDKLYLSKNQSGLRYGFSVQASDKRAGSPAQKGKRAAESGSVALLAAEYKRKRAERVAADSTRFLEGQHFIFWERRHMKYAIDRAEAAGATINKELGPAATHVIASMCITPSQVAAKLGQKEGEELQWPAGVAFVVPDFVSACLAQRKLLPPDQFLIAIRRSTGEYERSCGKPSEAVEAVGEEQNQGASMENVHADAVVEEGAPEKNIPLQERPSTIDGPAVADLTDQARQRKDTERTTGGDSGIPWGQGGCWVEPWSEEGVRDTLTKIHALWHRTTVRGPGSPSQGVSEASEPESGQSDSETEVQAGPLNERDCPHVACSASKVCLISQLKVLISQYDRSGTDQFRRRAADRAISVIAQHHKPLRTQEDVEALKLGEKSTLKVVEILRTGTLARNDAFLADPKTQTVYEFSTVWGAAQRTAIRWYQEGCRTLDDVRSRTDLTEQQVAGLRHFEDMRVRIPREEGAKLADTVCSAALQLFGWDLDGLDAPHIRPMGSFLRGKAATSDIDVLILPPEHERRSSPELMMTLLSHLHKQGFITDDMSPLKVRSPVEVSCTFLGFCKLPDQPYVRRIDIKIYPRWALPFAINYFTGSGAFCRALRYWAFSAPEAKQAAKQLAASSNGFKLSDSSLLAITKMGAKEPASVGPPVSGIMCETDIFRMLGLAYVPPYRRFFHDFQ